MSFEDMGFEDKKKKLLDIMDSYGKEDCVIAFSGGVDSSLLVHLACERAAHYKRSVYAVMIQSELAPAGDIDIARAVAAKAGADFVTLKIDELSEPGISDNSLERCYICKKYLFTRLLDFAREKGILTVLEGTNEDDLHVYRPGIRAIRELHIASPLALAGLTKAEVRAIAAQCGISVANRPSSPCLATRFPYGTRLTREGLHRVEQGEMVLRRLGFECVRLRVHENVARIEVEAKDMPRLLSMAKDVIPEIKALGYDYVTMDLEGFRSGSMDIHEQK